MTKGKCVVVYADPRGYMDKSVEVYHYAFDDPHEANWFAQAMADYQEGSAMNRGGYPGPVYVLDLNHPDSYDDPANWYEMFAEFQAEEVYDERIEKGDTEEDAKSAADTAYEEIMDRGQVDTASTNN